jgi:hypothetical protein
LSFKNNFLELFQEVGNDLNMVWANLHFYNLQVLLNTYQDGDCFVAILFLMW